MALVVNNSLLLLLIWQFSFNQLTMLVNILNLFRMFGIKC
uniref:Uncharacterized protein n=1 Tax=Siphoviridae sp. ctLqe90 TaxID=2825456 RepID=A0A8S5Q2W5_9CAUD|nr:MAG TPA: hypothetical protein [Siphoviridae sp. ctLqe90]DAH29759.1 MAG TPA: hypothetical protein [Caudoviricetes sp.]